MFTTSRLYRQIRLALMALLGVVFIFASLYYNVYLLREVLPMRSVRDQHIYQDIDRKEGVMPDACIRELIRDKTVLLPYRVRPYIEYNPIEDEEERGAGFVADYYVENNYTRYFNEYAKSSVYDESLPRTREVPSFLNNIPDMTVFTDLGMANDMLRYTFLLNKEHSKETKYFWYSWYYYSFSEEEDRFPHVYVNQRDCEKNDTIVAIWDEDENLYLMGKSSYDNAVK